LFVLKRLK